MFAPELESAVPFDVALSPTRRTAVLRADPMAFTARAFRELNPETPFIASPHISLMSAELEAFRLGTIKRLIINLPPRGLKSHCASIALPARILGYKPASRIICASYGQELADNLARSCRTLMQSKMYTDLFGDVLRDRLAVNDFATRQGGFRMATSVGGVLTGRGADFIIIDDAQKPDQAMSESGRTAVNAWFENSLLSRLNDRATGGILIIMQRLHQDDLCGHVLEKAYGTWRVLRLPAIADTDEKFVYETPYGQRVFLRKAGEVLHPGRDTHVELERMRETVGTYIWAAQYQQDPTPEGGAIVKDSWLKYFDEADLPNRFDRIVQSWDTANKSSELADYSVCTTWGEKDGALYLLHVFRGRLEYPDLKRKAIELSTQHDANCVLIEDHASGTQLIQDLKSVIWNVQECRPAPGADKIMRLHNQTPWFEGGKVFLPRAASWLRDYILELTGFPGTKHDDQVDSTTQALAYCHEDSGLAVWRKLAANSRPVLRTR